MDGKVRTLPLATAMLLLFLLGCRATQPVTTVSDLNIPELPGQFGKTWLEVDPDQCAGWWRDANGGVNTASIREHYAGLGFQVSAVKTATYEQKFGAPIAICEACGCPAGFTLYLLVADPDVDALLDMGHRHVVESCPATPAEIYIYGCPP